MEGPYQLFFETLPCTLCRGGVQRAIPPPTTMSPSPPTMRGGGVGNNPPETTDKEDAIQLCAPDFFLNAPPQNCQQAKNVHAEQMLIDQKLPNSGFGDTKHHRVEWALHQLHIFLQLARHRGGGG